MNRIWRGEVVDRYKSLLPIDEVFSKLPDDNSSSSLCLRGDVYSVYSRLHSEGRKCQIRTHGSRGFAYILATQPITQDQQKVWEFERVVPLPTNFQRLSIKLLKTLFDKDSNNEHELSSIIVAFVDMDGVAVLNRFHLGIFGPHPKQITIEENLEQDQEEEEEFVEAERKQKNTAASDEET